MPGFQAVLFRRSGPLQAALAGAALPLGLISHLPGVEIRAGRRIRLTGPSPGAVVPVQSDGDPAGVLPVTVEDADGPVRVLLP